MLSQQFESPLSFGIIVVALSQLRVGLIMA